MEISGFYATQILREMNFGHLKPPKTFILTICTDLKFEFLELLTFLKLTCVLKLKFKATKIVKITDFDLQKSASINFT